MERKEAKNLKEGFWYAVLSDNGEPSSSRVIMAGLSVVVAGIVIGVFVHMCKVEDLGQLEAWLGAAPILIGALIGLMVAPYTINRGAAAVAGIAKAVQNGSGNTTTVMPTPVVVNTSATAVQDGGGTQS